jgi:hypothetical protein
VSRPAVTIELNPSLARDLSAGGVFVPNCGLALQDECDVVVRAGDAELRLPARVVYVDPNKGNGLELLGFGPAIKEQLAALALIPASTQRIERIDPDHDEDFDDGEPAMIASAPPPTDEPGGDFKVDLEPDGPRGEFKVDLEPDGPRDVVAPEPTAESDADDDDDDASVRSIPRNVHERLRGLTMAEQLKIAHAGEMHERIVLERMYGKTVWEALIRNPRVTAAEIARIARMGGLPRPMIELICANGAWLQIPEIRRALLSNPRLGTDQILRVLRLMQKHELKICPKQVAYPMAVRDAAKKLLLGG